MNEICLLFKFTVKISAWDLSKYPGFSLLVWSIWTETPHTNWRSALLSTSLQQWCLKYFTERIIENIKEKLLCNYEEQDFAMTTKGISFKNHEHYIVFKPHVKTHDALKRLFWNSFAFCFSGFPVFLSLGVKWSEMIGDGQTTQKYLNSNIKMWHRYFHHVSTGIDCNICYFPFFFQSDQ